MTSGYKRSKIYSKMCYLSKLGDIAGMVFQLGQLVK